MMSRWPTSRAIPSPTASRWVRTRVARCLPCRPYRACDLDDPFADPVGKTSGFSLHAGVAAKARERDKLERLCRYITRPAVSEQRLSLTPNGNVRYQLKTPYRDGTTHVIFEPLDFIARLAALAPRPTSQSHPLPRRVRPQQHPSFTGDAGKTRQGQHAQSAL